MMESVLGGGGDAARPLARAAAAVVEALRAAAASGDLAVDAPRRAAPAAAEVARATEPPGFAPPPTRPEAARLDLDAARRALGHGARSPFDAALVAAPLRLLLPGGLVSVVAGPPPSRAGAPYEVPHAAVAGEPTAAAQ